MGEKTTLRDVLDYHKRMAAVAAMDKRRLDVMRKHGAMADAIDTYLARVGEPIYFCYDNGHWDLATKDWYDSWPAEKSKKLYAIPPIDLATVREVIADIRHWNEAICHPALNVFADNLEAAIKGVD